MKHSKANTLKILEEYYKVAREQKDAWDFFLNTAEYVRFVQGNSQLSEAVKQLEEQQKQAYEVFRKIDNKAIKELENVAKTVTETIKRLKINLEPVNNVLKELKQYNAGSILSSMSKAHKLDYYLFDIARNLKAGGFLNAVKQFIDEEKKVKNIYGNFTFSQTLPLRDRAEEELGSRRETELWGAWEDFPFISRIVFDGVNLEKELIEAKNHNDKMKKWALMNYIGTRTELGVMRARKKSESELVFLKASNFRKKLDRIHKYLITELLSETEEENQCRFDTEKSLLIVNGKDVKFRRFTEQYHTLRAMFENKDKLKEEQFFSAIAEKIDFDKGYTDKQLHNYLSAIKRRVAAETGIKDLFLTTNQSVRINPEYL